MSENCEYIDSILERSGRDQVQRFNEILDPDTLKLHDFDIEDWILFAYNFAKQVHFFDTQNDEVPSGNWQDFFRYFEYTEDTVPLRGKTEYQKLKEEIANILSTEEENGEVTPHFALFVCFLKLLQHSQDRFNGLTKRHLDFYYKEILQVEKQDAVADKVHLLFEIAKKSTAEKIDEGTALDGGKDAEGIKRTYKTETELIANKAKVTQLKNIYHHQPFEIDTTTGQRILVNPEIKAASIANSYNGEGEDFPDESDYWWPFGYPSNEGTYPDLNNAKVGFSLASPLFELGEGNRTIKITLTFRETLTTYTKSELTSVFTVYGSGAEEWVTSFEWVNASMEGTQIILEFTLGIDQPALTKYDAAVLEGGYDTAYPVLRFLIATSIQNMDTQDISRKGYHIYRELATSMLEDILVQVTVNGIASAVLENDTGVINVKKPFYPFTTNPIAKSNFSIDYAEAFSKSWSQITADIIWKDTPVIDTDDATYDSFQNHYANYTVTPTVDNAYFTAKTAILDKSTETYVPVLAAAPLFTVSGDVFVANLLFTNPGYLYDKSGPLRITLNQSFLQELYPTQYALAVAKAMVATSTDAAYGGVLIPKEPYIPLIESIKLNYIASASIKNENQSPIQLFHEDPFGQHQESINSENPTLVPVHCKGGSLFIGLEDAIPNQQVSLLIQVLEGSENPLETAFVGNQRVEWDVLCNNQWITLEDSILINDTDNLLNSGIIRFTLPKEATNDNTRLPAGYIWVRARIHKNYDAISKVKGIYAQAVVAMFENQENELSHLEQGLEAETISKLVTRIPQIKSVTQPFNSFDGKAQESDMAYYRRISERLRHKNRAITLWDYENLVLQEFPEIYKAKCLNHTSAQSFLSPGDVTLVVIPDTINKNVFDIFQPRVSKSTITKVQEYINALNSMHVNATVTNPLYEPVKVYLSAKFYDQYDVDFYKKQLIEDITSFLSPWAFDVSRTVDFGVVLYRSVLIDYLEKLYYVDYLENVVLEKVDQNGEILSTDTTSAKISIAPSTPSAILVSAKTHDVNTDIQPCNQLSIEPKEECQI